MVGKCLDSAMSQEVKNNVIECMEECSKRRGCEFSSFSKTDDTCTFHTSCQKFDHEEKNIETSKWDCDFSKSPSKHRVFKEKVDLFEKK